MLLCGLLALAACGRPAVLPKDGPYVETVRAEPGVTQE